MKLSDFIINENGDILSFCSGYLSQFPVYGVIEKPNGLMFTVRSEVPGWRDIDHYGGDDDYYDEFEDEYWWKR